MYKGRSDVYKIVILGIVTFLIILIQSRCCTMQAYAITSSQKAEIRKTG